MITEIHSREEFSKLLKERLVLIEFYSLTCGPCKMLNYVLRDVEKEMGTDFPILKIEFTEMKELVNKCNVSGYPTLALYNNGEELERLEGLQQKPAVLSFIRRHF